jgi:hypothetical protein
VIAGLLALTALLIAGHLVVRIIDLTNVHRLDVWCTDGTSYQKIPDTSPRLATLCDGHYAPNPNAGKR